MRVGLTFALCLCGAVLGAQVADRRLDRAVACIEKNDADGLHRLLAEDPSLVRLTGAGLRPQWRWTLLHLATSEQASLAVVSALVDGGSDVNAQDYEGKTPLHLAAARDYADLATVLLKHGARMNVVDGREQTPTVVAERGRFAKTANVLHAYARAQSENSNEMPLVYVPPAAGLPASIAGVVKGRLLWNGQPVAGASVYVADAPWVGSGRHGTATTDDQGRFSFTGVPPGHMYVGVNGDQRVAWISVGEPFVTHDGSAMTVRPFNQDFHVCTLFHLRSPARDESVGSRPVLRWDAFPDAKSYAVSVFDKTSSIARQWIIGAGVTSVQIDADLPPGYYEWRVDVAGAGGDAIGCSVAPRGFVVQREP